MFNRIVFSHHRLSLLLSCYKEWRIHEFMTRVVFHYRLSILLLIFSIVIISIRPSPIDESLLTNSQFLIEFRSTILARNGVVNIKTFTGVYSTYSRDKIINSSLFLTNYFFLTSVFLIKKCLPSLISKWCSLDCAS